MTLDWVKEVSAAITVCDVKGIIIGMNEKSAILFAKYGGKELIGKSLLDCHPPEARKILKEMLEKQLDNYYITDKEGVKKLIIQSPWYEDRKFMGLVEIVKEIEHEIPVFQR